MGSMIDRCSIKPVVQEGRRGVKRKKLRGDTTTTL